LQFAELVAELRDLVAFREKINSDPAQPQRSKIKGIKKLYLEVGEEASNCDVMAVSNKSVWWAMQGSFNCPEILVMPGRSGV
jgi:hypothetical protein